MVRPKEHDDSTLLSLSYNYPAPFLLLIVNELLLLPDTNVNALTGDHKTAYDIAEGLPHSEEAKQIKECLARYGAV